jgi:preprotein translocase subunit SecD
LKGNLGRFAIVVIPILAALALLYPTYRSASLKDMQAEAYARAAQAQSIDDSLAIIDEFNKEHREDLQNANSGALKLGLDLQGGMYVTLEVDVLKLIEEAAIRDAVDETFMEVIEKTRKELLESDEATLEVFLRNFDAVKDERGVSLLNYFDVGDIKDASREKIIEKLELNATQAVDQALEVIRQRIDTYGVTEPNIQKQGNRRIILELPGVKDESEVRSLLETTARLEFKLLRNNSKIVRAFQKIDKMLYEQNLRRKGIEVKEETEEVAVAADSANTQNTSDTTTVAANETATDTTNVAANDTAANKTEDTATKDNPYAGMSDSEAQKAYKEKHPFTSLFATYAIVNNQYQPLSYDIESIPDIDYAFMILKEQIELFNSYLSRPAVKALIPSDLEVAIDAKPDERALKSSNIESYNFYSLKRDAELTGEVITNAFANFDQMQNQPIVSMQMNTEGAEKWARITGANVGKRIAVVLDGRVYTAPNVQNKITGGSSQITGMADIQEARLLEIILKAGALKAPVQIVEERVVGPSLGEDSISSGINATMLAVALVIIFMIMYYSIGGFVADFAVLLNVTMIISVLAAFGGTLTLPGIAGIILTIGMAVDANVLIFERVREELKKGRSIKSAIDEGFQKALSAILDSNITTFITGLILFYLGSGPIKGFAMTLMIGIIGTLFTGIVVTRKVIEIMLGDKSNFNFGQSKNA